MLHNAIRKYGKEAFVVSSIFVSDDKEKTLKEMESKFIVEYNTHYIKGNGYNMTDGGEGVMGLIVTTEIRKRMSDAHIGHSPSIETRRKMSVGNVGQKRSEETCKRISEKAKERMRSEEHRKTLSEAAIRRCSAIGARELMSARTKLQMSCEGHRKKLSDAAKSRKRNMKHED
jgi:hypothetical protein